jgi:palmitoyltransferase
MNTHPGEIPLYWGFYIGDEDYKRKRYCLICNAFKPERSHHCSVCNICVLNMDHHCPWVDNCIGFYNRKYFMQLLFYLCVLTHYVNFTEFYEIYTILKLIYKGTMTYDNIARAAMVLFAYAIILTLSVLITLFFKFHIGLIMKNSTTIESLDKEHVHEHIKVNLYKISLMLVKWRIGYKCLERISFYGSSRSLLRREDLKEMVLLGKLI